MRLPLVGWVLVAALFTTGGLAMALGLLPLVILLAAMGWLAPVLGPLLAVAFDRWASGRLTRLLTLAFVLAAAASALLLALPVQTESARATTTVSVHDGQRGEEQRSMERTGEIHWPGAATSTPRWWDNSRCGGSRTRSAQYGRLASSRT